MSVNALKVFAPRADAATSEAVELPLTTLDLISGGHTGRGSHLVAPGAVMHQLYPPFFEIWRKQQFL